MKQLGYIVLILVSLNGFCQNTVNVFFDFNKDFPNPNSILEINEWISKHKNAEITKFMGYCDSIDSKDYNKNLAERRINNVQLLLEKSGFKIKPTIERIAIGKDFKQSKIQAENRRVTFEYQEIIRDTLSKTKNTLAESIKNAKKGDKIKLPNIYFFNNSARIVPKSQPTLYELLCAMEQNPTLKIEIQGHICCQRVFDANGVSTSRARAIYMFLIKNKIDRKRLTYKGYGTSRPIHPIPEQSADEEDENRRVEVMIVEK